MISKKSAWKKFQERFQLLYDIGETYLSVSLYTKAEKFVCELYNQNLSNVDEARLILCPKSNGPESLPLRSYQQCLEKLYNASQLPSSCLEQCACELPSFA